MTIRQPSNLNRLSQTSFRFSIDKLPTVSYFCQSANIPGMTLGSIDQPTRFNPIPTPANRVQFDDLNITFIVDEDMSNWFELWQWMIGLGFPHSHDEYNALFRNTPQYRPDFAGLYSDGTLHVLTNNKNYGFEVHYKEIFPISLSQIEFTATDTNNEAMIATASFKYMLYGVIRQGVSTYGV